MFERKSLELTDKHIGLDYISSGHIVSTVLLSPDIALMDNFLSLFPLDDRADLSTPGFYETMVFAANDEGIVTSWAELDFERYSTEKAAKDGHEKIVNKWMTK